MRKVVCINQRGWMSYPDGDPLAGPFHNQICQPVKDLGHSWLIAGFGDIKWHKSHFVDLIDDFNLKVYAKHEVI